jgi:alpha-1,6-mannosyltransferase
MRSEHLTRLAAITTLTFICLSVAVLVGVGAAGPSAATVRVHRAGAWPPWFASLHLSDLTVTAALWVALLLGAAGVAAGLVAVRRGWRPPVRWLVTGAVVAAIALAVCLRSGPRTRWTTRRTAGSRRCTTARTS